MSSKILSLVVARAGSKGLRNKSVLVLNNIPIFRYTVDYSKGLERIYPLDTIISTDSIEIINYCIQNDIEYIDRKKELTKDDTRIEEVIYDAINLRDRDYDYISLLYSDVPTRYPNEFKKAYEFLKNNYEYDCAMSFKRVKRHPEGMYPYNENILYNKKTKYYRKQDINKLMTHDGHTILFRKKSFMKFMESGKKVEYLYEAFGINIKPIINTELITSIDNMYDFKLAEKIL